MIDSIAKYNLVKWTSYINNNFNLVYHHRDIYADTVNNVKHIDYTLGIGDRADFIALFREAQNKLENALIEGADGTAELAITNTNELCFSLIYNYVLDNCNKEILTITIYEEH